MTDDAVHKNSWWVNPAIIVAIIAAVGGLGTALIGKLSPGRDDRCRVYEKDVLELATLLHDQSNKLFLYSDRINANNQQVFKNAREYSIRNYRLFLQLKTMSDINVTLNREDLLKSVYIGYDDLTKGTLPNPELVDGNKLSDKISQFVASCP
ncbi:hypothetical protein NKH10_23985 [Mesorhizobium sp. M1340]|uniref:hypothetical protein n=1 Tax=unclassified Mesorhizobium TaxID=325217 RepID=UPI003337FD34